MRSRRLRSTSAFAHGMSLTPGCVGVITARYSEDGAERVNVQIEGGPYCSGVLAEEVMVEQREGERLR